jgi:hypothetical protein
MKLKSKISKKSAFAFYCLKDFALRLGTCADWLGFNVSYGLTLKRVELIGKHNGLDVQEYIDDLDSAFEPNAYIFISRLHLLEDIIMYCDLTFNK